MNGLSYAGIVGGLLLVVAYVVAAFFRKKKIELGPAITIFIAVVSIVGGVRLIGAVVLIDEFTSLAKAAQTQSDSLWRISIEDAPFMVLGGLSLCWVSIQQLCEQFVKLR